VVLDDEIEHEVAGYRHHEFEVVGQMLANHGDMLLQAGSAHQRLFVDAHDERRRRQCAEHLSQVARGHERLLGHRVSQHVERKIRFSRRRSVEQHAKQLAGLVGIVRSQVGEASGGSEHECLRQGVSAVIERTIYRQRARRDEARARQST
jgi:hypothetical protein